MDCLEYLLPFCQWIDVCSLQRMMPSAAVRTSQWAWYGGKDHQVCPLASQQECRSWSSWISAWNLLLWGNVFVVYGNMKGYLWGIRYCIEGEGICYHHLLLQMEQHSLNVDWCICQIILVWSAKGACSCSQQWKVVKNMCGTILHQRHR